MMILMVTNSIVVSNQPRWCLQCVIWMMIQWIIQNSEYVIFWWILNEGKKANQCSEGRVNWSPCAPFPGTVANTWPIQAPDDSRRWGVGDRCIRRGMVNANGGESRSCYSWNLVQFLPYSIYYTLLTCAGWPVLGEVEMIDLLLQY